MLIKMKTRIYAAPAVKGLNVLFLGPLCWSNIKPRQKYNFALSSSNTYFITSDFYK